MRKVRLDKLARGDCRADTRHEQSMDMVHEHLPVNSSAAGDRPAYLHCHCAHFWPGKLTGNRFRREVCNEAKFAVRVGPAVAVMPAPPQRIECYAETFLRGQALGNNCMVGA